MQVGVSKDLILIYCAIHSSQEMPDNTQEPIKQLPVNTICPGGHQICPTGQTCCPHYASWGCCPFLAVSIALDVQECCYVILILSMTTLVFWVVMLYCLVGGYQRLVTVKVSKFYFFSVQEFY